MREELHQQALRMAAQENRIEQQAAQIDQLKKQLEQSYSPASVAQQNKPATAEEANNNADRPLESSTALRYKGITLTPGGFLEAATLVRTRNENADVTSNFSSMPFGGTANADLSELRITARGTRFSLLAETKTGKTKLSGYYELDFLGQAPTGNQVQTNSFVPRQRQLFAQIEFSDGITLTTGQMWSLITTDRKGMVARAEFIPTTVDGSYVVGMDYARQTAFRITTNFGNKTWLGLEVANPETNQPNASFVPSNLFGFNNSANAGSPNGSTLNFLTGSTNGFSTNLAPDLLAKVAFEPGWGHFELKTLGRFFRDRIEGDNNVTYGGGLGAAAVLPVIRKKIDFLIQGFAGSGIGRYGAANGPDVTLRPDGWIIPIHGLHALAGFEFHPQPKLDIYTYGGNEYYGRAAYLNPTDSSKPAGYGSLLVNNTNCEVEVVPSGGAACGAQNKDIYDVTAGFWLRFAKGPFGIVQYGTQYEYLHRAAWSGIGGTPRGIDNVVFSSIRYCLP